MKDVRDNLNRGAIKEAMIRPTTARRVSNTSAYSGAVEYANGGSERAQADRCRRAAEIGEGERDGRSGEKEEFLKRNCDKPFCD
ncbi:hypothetical protein L596_024808 [Steinernema carpocapsae]|uniref:Uncharacterized protein n=1 Tax=Steinernema carpocapsae TaxID=34508 RepID=A0A4U5M5V1_STECR|nr:hypothetical protein L596_024808 [Steinernema carpocapsae]